MDEIYEKYSKDIQSSSQAGSKKAWYSGYLPSWFSPQKKEMSELGKLDLEQNEQKGEKKSLITTAKAGFFEKATEVSEKVQKKIDTGSNYYMFTGFFILACLFFLLAFTVLPFILVSPAKFNLFFSLGSLFSQIALAFFHGPLSYVKMLLSKQNLIISVIYVATLVLSLYASMFWGTYLSSFVILLLQVVTLGYFLMQSFAGGDAATENFKNMFIGNMTQRISGLIKFRKNPRELYEL